MRAKIALELAGAAHIREALARLVAINVAWFRSPAGRNAPPIDEAGVIYRRERQGREDWLSAPVLLRLGVGDCEDLAAYEAAYRIVFNRELARADIIKQPATDRVLYHAVVILPGGRISDPSRRLGMKG